jgi:hypothetical protein
VYIEDMTDELDIATVFRLKRRRRKEGLSDAERVAINLFRRKGVKVSLLARVFKVAKNTCYYKAVTGEAPSYPTSMRSNPAGETNAIIEELGEERAWKKFVTPKMRRAVNAALKAEEARRDLEEQRDW